MLLLLTLLLPPRRLDSFTLVRVSHIDLLKLVPENFLVLNEMLGTLFLWTNEF